jgi:hypothetical protein
MKKIVLLFVLFTYSFSIAQENYKYVIVPKKFSFFSHENEYNTSSMTKAFFEKEGFVVYYDTDEFPSELASNRCLALYVNALKKSNMFVTKVNFELKDCANKIIYTSIQGSSKEKEYQKSYNESFRMALMGMKGKLIFKREQKQQNEIFVAVESPSKSDVVPDPVKEDSTKKTNNKQFLKNNKFEITEMHSESALNALSNAPNEFETFDSNICVDTMLQKQNVGYAS